MNIAFQSSDILVVEKPSGWLTTPARLANDSRTVLGREIERRLGIQIFPVHRLDFEVSGLTLWAKNPEAHRRAQAWFEHGTVGKLYEALSRPGPEIASEHWVDWTSCLVRGKRRSFVAAHGKASQTRARKVGEEQGAWRWQLMPLTGRPHQLRVEMAVHGYPLIGDVLYGGEVNSRSDWIALRAIELSFAKIPQAERLGLPESIATTPLSL